MVYFYFQEHGSEVTAPPPQVQKQRKLCVTAPFVPSQEPIRTADGSKQEVPYRTVPYRTVPYRTVPYRTVPYRTVPYRTVPYRTVPYLTCHAILQNQTMRSLPTNQFFFCFVCPKAYSTIPYKAKQSTRRAETRRSTNEPKRTVGWFSLTHSLTR
jgi:hypothetical protein